MSVILSTAVTDHGLSLAKLGNFEWYILAIFKSTYTHANAQMMCAHVSMYECMHAHTYAASQAVYRQH